MHDETGTACIHIVPRPDGSFADALAALLHATGSALKYRHERRHAVAAHGSVLLDDGTAVPASALTR
ncbi:hypothetical protein [Streptomyces sp. enrichment culture]|uniref:hypothetical protein n=1 Tax=Streptomyces sp. enrichment culture TaxID=1795815 RepID=UPI003F56D6E6